MKTYSKLPSSKLSFRKCQIPIIVMFGALLCSTTLAVNITVYEDSGFDTLRFSLDNLALPYNYHDGDDTSFVADLTSGTFDLALINQSAFTNLNDDLDDIHNFVLGGGKLIIANYDYDSAPGHALWQTMGAKWEADLASPANPIVRWVPSHPIFNLLNTVPDLVPTDDAADNGDLMSALATGTSVAGLAGANPLESLIIVRNDGQTILNSFLPYDYQGANSDMDGKLDVIELFENQISFVIPEPTTIILLGLGGLAAIRKRRSQ